MYLTRILLEGAFPITKQSTGWLVKNHKHTRMSLWKPWEHRLKGQGSLTSFHKLFSACQNPLWKNYCFPNGAANLVSSHAYQTLRILDTGLPGMNLHHWENCSYNLKRSQFVLLSLKFSGHLETGADTATCFQCHLLLTHSVIHFTANLDGRGRWSEKLKDLPCLGILNP